MKDILLTDGDLTIRNGKIVTVEKKEKLQQQMLKIIIASVDFYLHPRYGSNLMDILGEPYTDLESGLKATIRTALDYYISLQAKGITFDIYDLEEILYKISYMTVQQFEGDPRGAILKMGVLDGTRKNVEITETFTT